MYFRLHTNQVEHERVEYSFVDLLGDMGGIGEILTKTFILVFGGFLEFNSSVEMMKELYKRDPTIKELRQVYTKCISDNEVNQQ